MEDQIKLLQELINKSWDLVEVHNVDGDLLPCLDSCQEALYAIEESLVKNPTGASL